MAAKIRAKVEDRVIIAFVKFSALKVKISVKPLNSQNKI